MSGMSISGQIMIQEPSASGFSADVYPTRLDAAIQLLRVIIRRSADEQQAIEQIEKAVAELIRDEKREIEEACGECGNIGCNGECFGDDMMGSSS